MRSALYLVLLVTATALAQSAVDPLIATARHVAATFQRTLPDYIVRRTTVRYHGNSKSSDPSDPVMRNWLKLDVVTATVATEHSQEVYSAITVNGKAAENLPADGAWSVGEFSSVLLETLSPSSAAVFTNPHNEDIRGHAARRFDYAIDEDHSRWHLNFQNGNETARDLSPANGGAIWLDRDSGQVLKIQRAARDLPKSFPIEKFQAFIDYEFVDIGGAKALLPVHASSTICLRETPDCFRNETTFEDYKKFAAATNITFDGASQ